MMKGIQNDIQSIIIKLDKSEISSKKKRKKIVKNNENNET